MPDKKAVFTRIVLTLGADPSLIVEGSFSLEDVNPLIDKWVGLLALSADDAERLRVSTERLGEKRREAVEALETAPHVP